MKKTAINLTLTTVLLVHNALAHDSENLVYQGQSGDSVVYQAQDGGRIVYKGQNGAGVISQGPGGTNIVFQDQDGRSTVYQIAAAEAPPPASAATKPDDDQAALEAKLDAARKKLEADAEEVAALSGQMGGPVVQRFSTFHADPDHAIIGVQLDTFGGKDGARVLDVSPGGPAAEAGMRAGDLIVAVNGTDVKGDDSARRVIKIMRDAKPDSKVTVRVLRDGRPQDFTIVARRGPPVVTAFAGRIPDFGFENFEGLRGVKPLFMVDGPLANMELATLTPQLGRYFGTDKGVLVVRAPTGGALKLEDGDIILAIDGREPTSGSHATRILGSYQPGEKIALRIMRDRKTMEVDTTLPEPSEHPARRALMFRPAPRAAPLSAPPKQLILRDDREAT